MLPHLNGKLPLKLVLFPFALLDAPGYHINGLSTLQRFPEVFNGCVGLLYRRLDTLDCGAVIIGLASRGNRSGNFLNVSVSQQLAALQNNPVLNLLFADDFLLALAPLVVVTGVVMIGLAGFACAAVAGHHLPAIAAEQFGCQKIFFLASGTGGGFLVAVKDMLYPFKKLILNNARHTIGRFCGLIDIIADVPFVPQEAVQTVFVKLLAQRGLDLLCVQILGNLCNRFSAGVHFKYLPHNSCALRVDMKTAFLVHIVAEAGIAAV